MIYTKSETSALQSLQVIYEKANSLISNQGLDSLLRNYLDNTQITQKSDLIRYSEENIDRLLSHAVLFSETSGTTGKPLMTPRYNCDLDWNINNQIFAYKKNLNPNTDRVAILHPGILSPFLEASSIALKTLDVGYTRIFPIENICDYRRILDILDRYKITTIMSTPSLLYKLFYEIKCNIGSSVPQSVNKLLVTGEHFSLSNKVNMERIVTGAKAIPFVYGSSEVATTMIGEEPFGYRPILEDFIFEVIDCGSEPVNDYSSYGSFHSHGKLLVTWLRTGALPILRYDTKDIFTVVKCNKDGYLFFNEGRSTTRDEYRILENIIGDSIYESGFPIYHLECFYEKSSSRLEISVITDSKLSGIENEIHSRLSQNLPSSFKISVEIDRNNSDFFNFSPKPKLQKLTIR